MTGLVGWWPMHREEGDAVDLSGNGNGGTITGATRGVAGRGGLQAFSFDGTDDGVDVGDVPPLTASSLEDSVTVSAWVYPRDAGSIQSIAGKASDLNNDNYRLSITDTNSDGTYGFSGYIDSTDASLQIEGGAVTANEWSHTALTYNGAEMNVYVDGASTATDTTVGGALASSTSPFTIGSRGGDSQFMDGLICDVRVYNRALSSNELAELYEWGAGDYAIPPGAADSGAVSYWNLDEDSGSTTTDAWGSNDGTVNGATVGVTGVRDTAYSFDGTDDYVNFGDLSTLEGISNFTVGAWFKHDVSSTAEIITKGNSVSGTDIWGLFLSSSAELRAYYGDDTGTWSAFGRIPVAAGEWYHAATTFNSGVARLYLNGELAASDTSAYSATLGTSASVVSAGARGAGDDRFYSGDIDDIRAYTRTLSPAEVYQLYRYGTRGRDLRKKTVNAI